MAIHEARERAEEFLGSLQIQARKVWADKANWKHNVRSIIDESPLSRAETRRRLNRAIRQLKTGGARIERRAYASWQRLGDRLPVATRAEVDKLGRQVKVLNRKVGELAKKLAGGPAAS